MRPGRVLSVVVVVLLVLAADYSGVVGNHGEFNTPGILFSLVWDSPHAMSTTVFGAIAGGIIGGPNGIGGPSGGQMARRRYQRGGLRLVGGRWKLEWREDVVLPSGSVARRRRAETLGTIEELPTERMARRAADAVLARAGINALDYKPGRVATFGDFAELWERDVLALQKPSAQPPERSRLNKHLLPVLDRMPMLNINQQLIQGLIRRWTDEGMSVKSIRNLLTTLHGMLEVAKEWGYMTGGFKNTVKLPARRLRPRGRRYRVDEAKAIIAAAPFPWNYMLLTDALTGIRRGELLGLRWQDIDFENEVIRIEQSVWAGELQTTKSEESDRTVPLPSALGVALRQYRKQWTPNPLDLLWANEDGNPIDADNLRNRVIRPLLDQAGIVGRAGFHAFRHLHGTLLVSVGANPKVAQAQLGHAQPSTTMELYVDVVSDDHRKAVEKVAEILAPVGAETRPNLIRVK